MEAIEFAKELQKVFEKLKSDGLDEINLEHLIMYLNNAKKNLEFNEAIGKELYKERLQNWIKEYPFYIN